MESVFDAEYVARDREQFELLERAMGNLNIGLGVSGCVPISVRVEYIPGVEVVSITPRRGRKIENVVFPDGGKSRAWKCEPRCVRFESEGQRYALWYEGKE